jgi:hypothetical protein
LPLVFGFLTPHLQAQFTNPCSGEKGVASIPPEVLKAFGVAAKIQDRQEAIKKEIEIARKPRSGLTVAYVDTSGGKVVRYMIVVASAPTCTLALMPFDPGLGHRPNVQH